MGFGVFVLSRITLGVALNCGFSVVFGFMLWVLGLVLCVSVVMI